VRQAAGVNGHRVLGIVYTHLMYHTCPRGEGDAESHRRKHLVHRVVDDQPVCMFAELDPKALQPPQPPRSQVTD
jgi:hypothetical protein